MRSRRWGAHGATPILHEHQRHTRTHETLTHVTLAQHPSSLTWGHPHAHSTTVCSLHGGNGKIAHALTTPNRTQGSSLIAPLTHHFTDGQFCDHIRRRPISGQRKHASRQPQPLPPEIPQAERALAPSRRIRPPCPRQREASELGIAADSHSERCVCPSSPPHASCGTRAAKVDKTR